MSDDQRSPLTMTTKVDCLDHGFVKYIGHLGSDLEVVNDARVSFKKQAGEFLTERDEKLIRYLAREGHWSPFAHQIIKLHVKAPIFIRTQMFKHKVGFQENEVSRRYVTDEPEFYCPSEWRKAPEGSIKQGSGDPVVDRVADGVYDDALLDCLGVYHALLEKGYAPEMARMVLPQSLYTEWRWTGSLIGFTRFYKQRSDTHAQWEVRQFADAVKQIIQPLFPCAWAALTGE